MIGEGHAETFLGWVDGILEHKDADGVIEPVEFQHYFEYIIARDGYEAAVQGKHTHFFLFHQNLIARRAGLKWIEDWIQHRKDVYAHQCRKRLNAVVKIQSRFRCARLRYDRKRWNEKFETRRTMIRLEKQKARAKRVGMMRKWNETRLQSKLESELKLQSTGNLMNVRLHFVKSERNKMSIEELSMKSRLVRH